MVLKSRKFLIYLSAFWLILIMALGCWWLFLIVKISTELKLNMMKMAKWEGAAFLLLLLFISVTLFYFYLQDVKKNQALASFFASLSHELKTPLASMRLQAEVIKETSDGHLQVLTSRLIEDAQRLEDELDKLLQLSRIERGGSPDLKSLSLSEFFNNFKRRLKEKFALHIVGDVDQSVLANEFSLNLILRNLLDNSLKHANSNKATITVQESGPTIEVVYDDEGSPYKGELKRLGELFYKSSHSKGQGIGLYLIKTLMDKMGGRLQIVQSPHLVFHLIFQKK